VKICDLGFACLVNTGEDIRDIIGTPDYVGKLVYNAGMYCYWSVFSKESEQESVKSCDTRYAYLVNFGGWGGVTQFL